MNRQHLAAVLAALHVIAAILTYGHAYHAPNVKEPVYADGEQRTAETFMRVTGALFCGLFWPLYWSAHLMEPKEKQ